MHKRQPAPTCLAARAAASRALIARNFSPRSLLGAAGAEVEGAGAAAASTCLALRRAFSSLPVPPGEQGRADRHLGGEKGATHGWQHDCASRLAPCQCWTGGGGHRVRGGVMWVEYVGASRMAAAAALRGVQA